MIADILVAGIIVFLVLMVAPMLSGIGMQTTQTTAGQVYNFTGNMTQANTITQTGTVYFLNVPNAALTLLYFIFVIAALLLARYEGADLAVTLIVGVIFLSIALLISAALANAAHNFMTSAAFASVAPYYQSSTAIVYYLPYFTGIFTIVYIWFVISKGGGKSSGGGSGGGGIQIG
jgi:hypothetical protein